MMVYFGEIIDVSSKSDFQKFDFFSSGSTITYLITWLW